MTNHKKKREPIKFTPMNILYERLLPLIRDLLEFKWPAPIQTDPSQKNKSLRCNYHRDNGHETDRCRSLNFLVEKLVKVGHLKRYIKEADHRKESGPTTDRIAAGAATPSEPRPVINYILGGPSDNQSKC